MALKDHRDRLATINHLIGCYQDRSLSTSIGSNIRRPPPKGTFEKRQSWRPHPDFRENANPSLAADMTLVLETP